MTAAGENLDIPLDVIEFYPGYPGVIFSIIAEAIAPTIPEYAWWSTARCETYVESNCTNYSTQEGLDSFFETLSSLNRALLSTNQYHHSADEASTEIKDYFIDNDDYICPSVDIMGCAVDRDEDDLDTRDIYFPGSTAASSSRQNINLTLIGQPFQELTADWDQFKIEPVLRAGFLPGIRPGQYGGLTLHPDRYATIRVLDVNGTLKYSTTNFLLQSVAMTTKESFSVSSAFTGNTLQFSEEKFKIFKLNLSLIDAEYPFDWKRAWETNWYKYMRGSQLVKDKSRFYILYGSNLIGGYPLQYAFGASANDEPYSALSVDIFVTDNIPLPEMNHFVSKAGDVWFKWTGTEYSTEDLDEAIQSLEASEYTPPQRPPSKARKAITPSETEYESDWSPDPNSSMA